MRTLLFTLLAAGALAVPELASAGCLATVGLAPPPAGIEPGETWTARMTVLQHGQTPLPNHVGARPTITIRNEASSEKRTFTARPTGKAGVYVAEVVFPSAGAWRYEVFDDFTSWNGEPVPCARTHTFSAAEIGGPPSAGPPPRSEAPASAAAAGAEEGRGFPLWVALSCAFGLAALAAAGGFVLRHRRERVAN